MGTAKERSKYKSEPFADELCNSLTYGPRRKCMDSSKGASRCAWGRTVRVHFRGGRWFRRSISLGAGYVLSEWTYFRVRRHTGVDVTSGRNKMTRSSVPKGYKCCTSFVKKKAFLPYTVIRAASTLCFVHASNNVRSSTLCPPL